jgi:putative phosphoribosyl transferase
MMLDQMARLAKSRGPRSMWIPVAKGDCAADLWLPKAAAGLVVVIHGSGSGKGSPRNRQVAESLFAAGWAVLLFDLLTPEERRLDERSAQFRYDVSFLSGRVAEVLDWLPSDPKLAPLGVVLFGGSTGAALALSAAASHPDRIRGVVLRGGRPDLVSAVLPDVVAPVLSIVGGTDSAGLEIDRRCIGALGGPVVRTTVPGASHLFEEPGTLDMVVTRTLDFLEELRDLRSGVWRPGMFRDRDDAGRWLAGRLLEYRDRSDVLVMGLPRGGVPVAAPIARALRAPLDIWVVRKIGAPGNPELAMGAVASGGVVVRNDDVVGLLGVTEGRFARAAALGESEVRERELLWRGAASGPQVAGKTVLVVDDGVATGATVLSAAAALRQAGAGKVVAAAPVASLEASRRLRDSGVATVFLAVPDDFDAVGKWYSDFGEVNDETVALLLHAEGNRPSRVATDTPEGQSDASEIARKLFGDSARGHPRASGGRVESS